MLFSFSQDPNQAYYLHTRGEVPALGDSSIGLRDMDGSLLGERKKKWSVTTPGVYYADAARCSEKRGWNLQVCKEHYLKFHLAWPDMEEDDASTLTDLYDEVWHTEGRPRANVMIKPLRRRL